MVEEYLLLQNTFKDFVGVYDFLETTWELYDEGFMNVNSTKTVDQNKKKRKKNAIDNNFHLSSKGRSTFIVFGSDDIGYIRRPIGSRYDPKYLIPTVTHEGSNILEWGCFRRCETEPIAKIDGKMNTQEYVRLKLKAKKIV